MQDPLFLAIRDCCVQCIDAPTVDAVKRLTSIVSAADVTVLNPIQKYILFPVQQILNKSHSDPLQQLALVCECCKCLQALFDKTSVESFQEFADMFVSLFMLADQRLHPDVGSPEDLRLYTLEAAYSLIQCTSSKVVAEALHDELFHKALGHAISVTLAISTRDSSKSLQITAVKILQLWFQRSDTTAVRNECNRLHLMSLYQSFLPGISIAIMNLLTRDDKLPQALICTSLSVLSLALCLSMPEVESEARDGDDRITESGKNLRTIFSRISPELMRSPNIRVRRSLFHLCTSVVENCCSSLIESLHEVLFEVLLTLCMEEDESLRNDATDFVTSLLERETRRSRRVYQSLEVKALECMESLMEQITDMSPDEKVRRIQFLAGMFSMMHPRGCNLFMNIPSHRHRFIRFLILVCRLKHQPETDFVRINETSELKLHFFASSDEERGAQMIRSMLHFIASKLHHNVIEDIVNDLNEQSLSHPEAIFAVNEIIRQLKASQIPVSHVENCIQILEQECGSGQPLVGQAVTRLVLVMEGLSICLSRAQHVLPELGSKDDKFLLQLIYLLLNVLSYQVSQTSSSCERLLKQLSARLHYATVSDMIQDKLFYLTSRLQRDQQLMPSPASFSHTANLLQTMLSFSSCNNISSYEQLVKSNLKTLDALYTKTPSHILQALLVLVNFVSRNEVLHQVECIEVEERDPFLRLSDFERKWQQFVADIKAGDIDADDAGIIEEERIHDEDARDQQNEQPRHESARPPPPPPASSSGRDLPPGAQMVRMILEKCSNLLGSPESTDRILVLEIISKAAVILKDYEDIFLPFVHKMWKQLLLRLSDSEVAVARAAFHLLLVLSEVSGDFIQTRTAADVLPKITSFLRQHSQDGVRKESRIAHRFTITFKYQLECLLKIGPLTVGLNVQGKELWKLMAVVLMYTSGDQPKELRAAAAEAIQFLRSQDPDSLWFYEQLPNQTHISTT